MTLNTLLCSAFQIHYLPKISLYCSESMQLYHIFVNFSTEKFGGSSCGTGYSRTAEMKLSDSHSFSTIDSIGCELSVVPDWLGEKVKTVARIKTRTYTAIMPPTMKAIAFQTLFARLFLIASCSLIRESCSAKASGCSSALLFAHILYHFSKPFIVRQMTRNSRPEPFVNGLKRTF